MVGSIFAALGIVPAVFMKSAFEVSLISLLCVCLIHSWFTHGWKRTVREFVAGFFMTACCESIGVLSGAYVYPGFHFYVFATPIANPASWIASVYIIIEVTNRLMYGRRSLQTYECDGLKPDPAGFFLFRGSFLKTLVVLAVVDSALLSVIDLIMDPLATIFNWWVWVPSLPGVSTVGPGVVNPYNFTSTEFFTTPPNIFADFFGQFFPHGLRYPTRVLGIPLINFLAWFIFIFVFVFAFEFRFVESRERLSELGKTVILWGMVVVDIPILAAVLIIPNI